MSLSNSRCRFFEMKNIISKGYLFWKEGDQVPSPDYGLKFPTKSKYVYNKYKRTYFGFEGRRTLRKKKWFIGAFFSNHVRVF